MSDNRRLNLDLEFLEITCLEVVSSKSLGIKCILNEGIALALEQEVDVHITVLEEDDSIHTKYHVSYETIRGSVLEVCE